MSFLRNLKRGIRNIIYWLPVIWKDCHWDYAFLLYILKHKLEAIRADTVNWISEGNDKIAEDIEYAICLIDIINNEEYEKEAFDKHAAIWGRPQLTFGPTDSNLSKMNIVYPGVSDQPVQREADEELSKLIREAWKKRQEAIDKLFEIIKDNFETWWD